MQTKYVINQHLTVLCCDFCLYRILECNGQKNVAFTYMWECLEYGTFIK